MIAHFNAIGAFLHDAGHQGRQCIEAAYFTLSTCVSSWLANCQIRTTAANIKTRLALMSVNKMILLAVLMNSKH